MNAEFDLTKIDAKDRRPAEVTFTVVGSQGARRLVGDTRLPGVVHRYVGASDAWLPGIETYARVIG